MVSALLEGRKTQTRRTVKPGPGQSWLAPETISEVRRFAPGADGWWTMAVGEPKRIVHCGCEMDGGHIGSVRCPYGAPGDRLWVRETLKRSERGTWKYAADQRDVSLPKGHPDVGAMLSWAHHKDSDTCVS